MPMGGRTGPAGFGGAYAGRGLGLGCMRASRRGYRYCADTMNDSSMPEEALKKQKELFEIKPGEMNNKTISIRNE